ncbi:energy-coupling factor transporter transmembrane component T family protein [Halalkalicoccus jeotgali]|uniref:Cobalt ABC transporter permease n=1 Tax=Halalkalicoccus jeotgali (strain DSM 18796 / CECT 7217 / JCM 14584 / KCTC 4019 / B3) TaxID=795797 RepID=D8J4B9_HALJB|nr:energy-coupling factor transporter transmembrane component T [Halalkalicoccus jeotgali]ADJ13481.1 cobalt ABC transporter permease [Halalkalicoccus jeotgali B3]ELY33044.1 cobalt ABC transporter permease [Halalkalicoccus jeotgali B3]
MLSYSPGNSLAHRLDPRTKLAVQIAFVAAAFAHTTPAGLTVLSLLALCVLASARLSPFSAIYAYRFALPVLLVGPLIEGVGLSGFAFERAFETSLASYRVLLVLLVSAAYVRSTPVRESRAAIQWAVPGRAGAFLGMGTAFVFRLLPLLVVDLKRTREAMAARLSSERPVHERMALLAVTGVNRALARADGFSLALRARCFAWNPTLPRLAFSRADLPALALACGLAFAALY